MCDRELARPARMRRAGNDECETSRGSPCDGAYEVRMLCSADPSHRRGRDPETNLGYRTPCNRDITFNTSGSTGNGIALSECGPRASQTAYTSTLAPPSSLAIPHKGRGLEV